jgi:hypothetical protein
MNIVKEFLGETDQFLYCNKKFYSIWVTTDDRPLVFNLSTKKRLYKTIFKLNLLFNKMVFFVFFKKIISNHIEDYHQVETCCRCLARFDERLPNASIR